MKKVVYVSPESFIDVDLAVIGEINKKAELIWVVLFFDLDRSDEHVFSPDYIREYCSTEKIKCTIIISDYRVRDPRRLILAWKIIKVVLENKPDVIYFEGFSDLFLLILARTMLGKSKVIVGIHDVELHPGNINIIHRVSQRMMLNCFHNFHVFSLSQKNILNSKYTNKKIFVIGLFLKKFGLPRLKDNIQKEHKEINFLFFGRDYYYKGLDILINAANLLSKTSARFKITIIGKSNNFKRFDSLIIDQSIYNLRTKFVKSEEIADIFNDADFLILPYRQVTQCGPLMIALNYNVPVIASDLPGFSEYIVNGENGFLFSCGDYVELAEKMKMVLTKSEIELLQIKANLSTYVSKHFNIEYFIEKYIEMFSSV